MEVKIANNMNFNNFGPILVIDEWLSWPKKYLYSDMIVKDTMGNNIR